MPEVNKSCPERPANPSPSGKIRDGDLVFLSDIREAIVTQKTPCSLVMIWMVAFILITGLVWAKFAVVEEVTVGDGVVIPASREQVIQSLEGGILEEMNVKEGDIVEKGQVLVRIDQTRAGASHRESVSKVLGLKGTLARLRAEAYGTPLSFPADVQKVASIVRDETQAYNARRQALDENIAGLKRSLSLAESEVRMSEPLMRKGLMSEVELLRMQRQANEFRLKITETGHAYRSEANVELTRLESELSQAVENVTARADVMNRTTVLAPVRGTVKNIKVTTIGGVIPQNGDIMTIIPLGDQLLIEAKIKPADVAFLRPGLPAMVKITAYNFAIYGGLSGKVELISPDTIQDDESVRQGKSKADTTFYRVYIRTDKAALQVKNKIFPIMPGMVASAEIRTGEKTILDYILKPVFRAQEAFRER
ncbi:HlyD family efflux transporter periplasmic adaptor subunit [Citrobacter sedlakii]|nr:HlyD family efflux transporter periplasmic adaptor subunit [Citrobacter sedlakii]QUC32432.1 HlyD family efflux transporter periplasmic adaptor subunit [Citrobacter sedlakii]